MITRANFWFVFGGVWLAVGTLFVAVGGAVLWYERALDEQLVREGVTASGVVLAKSRYGRANQEPKFRVEYRFKAADGTQIERTADVDRETWNALSEGGAVEVRYARSAPERHRLRGESGAKFVVGLVFSALGSLLAISGLIILWRAVARRKFTERLLREGSRAQAEVVEIFATHFRINRVPQWAIRYRYRDLFGGTHEGRTPPMPPDQAQHWKPGDRGEVRFETRRPQRSIWVGRG
jgi:Protein of unknown function (DUF3592)